jgi:outer membrane protein OmpA-like peptidoglycan-associated protein
MKTLLRVFLASCLFYASIASHAQTKKLQPGYYVVVGAYAATRENVAQSYVDALAKDGLEAYYGFNEPRNLFFVYVKYFDNLKGSLQYMQKTRKNERFKDAWVRVVTGDITPVTAVTPSPTTSPDLSVTTQRDEKASKETPIALESGVPPIDSVVVTDNEEIVQYKKMTLGNTEVFLSLFHARNNRIVDGDVQVIDTDRAKALTKVKGNEYLLLPDPRSSSGQLTLVCDVFGYRKVQQEINYPVPLADTVKPYIDLMGTTVVVKFDLVRYYRGDKAIMYNVYFYNDAAVMAPESKYELNALLQMMQEMPSYKIMLHGHTNGNYNGRIKGLGPEKNFFSLTGSVEGVGSAKDLSRKRAETIREYLVTNGISADRISIKAWGGKRPLYDRRGANAKKNVRVEVEILED